MSAGSFSLAYNALIGVYGVIFIGAVGFQFLFWRALRKRDPDLWAKYRDRSRGSGNQSWQALRFLIGKQYEALGDPSLNTYGRWARWGFLGILIMLAIMIALTLAGQYVNGVWHQPAVVKTAGPAGMTTLAAIVIYLASLEVVSRRLKSRYNAVWTALGEPALFNPRATKLLNYVFSAMPRRLNDPTLFAFVVIVRISFVVGTVLMIGIFTRLIKP